MSYTTSRIALASKYFLFRVGIVLMSHFIEIITQYYTYVCNKYTLSTNNLGKCNIRTTRLASRLYTFAMQNTRHYSNSFHISSDLDSFHLDSFVVLFIGRKMDQTKNMGENGRRASAPVFKFKLRASLWKEEMSSGKIVLFHEYMYESHARLDHASFSQLTS